MNSDGVTSHHIGVACDVLMIGARSDFDPPEKAKYACPNSRRRSASTGRADRTGPINGTSLEWNTAINRVRPASTGRSNTMSAWFRPDCGHAPNTLSIFTASAGRVAAAAVVAGRPVSGSTAWVADGDG